MPNHKFSVVIPLSTTFQPERRRGNVGGRRSQGKRKNYVEHSQFRWLFIRVKCHTMRVLYKHICVICKCVWMFFFFSFLCMFCLSFRFLKRFLMQLCGLLRPPCHFPLHLSFPISPAPVPLTALSHEMRDLCGDLRATQKWTCVNLCALQAQKKHTHTHTWRIQIWSCSNASFTHTHTQTEGTLSN